MADVIHKASENRFEITEDGHTAFTAYKQDGDVWTFHHTEVPEALSGKGIGTRLVEAAMSDVKAHGGKVNPTCSFVRNYIDKHPDSATLA